MANRALTFGFGGYADLDITFGEFFHQNHTVMLRFMPQHPYGGPGPMLAENGSGTYVIGQGDYRWGSGDFKKLGPSTLFVQTGSTAVTYEVPAFENTVGGPVGYRNVWQHLAVRRQGNTIELFLNGQKLSPFESPDLTVPASGLPSGDTPLRVGRRSSGTSASKRFWQFYGLVDDLAIYSVGLSDAALQQAVGATLTGSEPGLVAGWTFDTGRLPAKLARPVTLPTATDIPEHVTEHASHPVPAYYVNVSADRNSSVDQQQMDLRPSKVRATVPVGAGEWWEVVQGWEDPHVSHNGGTAAFCWDFHRVNGATTDAPVFAAAPGKLIFVDPDGTAISCYHAPFERVVYMHLPKASHAKFFPQLAALPQNLPAGEQPAYGFRDPIAESPAGNLHFATAAIVGETATGDAFPEAGGSLPNALEDYYISKDKGQHWTKVARGIPVVGNWVARYPWSPWGERGDTLSVAPAVASWGHNRLDVFVRGENDHLWHKRWNGEEWSEWRDLGGGRLTSSPAAVSWGPNRIDVFVRGFEHQLAHKRWTDDKGWSEWRDLGGTLASAPAVASWGPDRLDVFARGMNDHLWHKRWNGEEWSEWRDLGGGRLTSAPAAVSWGPNRVDVLVRGFEGQLAQKRWTDAKGWSEWRDLGGRLTSAPAAASWAANRLDVFARGHEGSLAHKRWNGEEWSSWRDLGGRLTSGPAAVSWGLNRIDVFVRGFEHQLAHKRWTDDQDWSEWRNLDKD